MLSLEQFEILKSFARKLLVHKLHVFNKICRFNTQACILLVLHILHMCNITYYTLLNTEDESSLMLHLLHKPQ